MILVLSILSVIYLILYFTGIPYDIEPSHFYTTNSIIYLILTVWYMYKYKRENIICFELLFSLSYWLCCFFAIFVLNDIDNYIVSQQLTFFSTTMLCRSCILCMIGYLFYLLGLCCGQKKKICNVDFVIRQNPLVNKLLNSMTTFFIILFFVLGGYTLYYSYDQTVTVNLLGGNRFGRFGTAMALSFILLNISTISNLCTIDTSKCNSIWKFLKSLDIVYSFNMLVMSLFLLACGYRSGVMQIIIPFFVVLSLRKIIKTKTSILIIVMGLILLALVGLLRSRTSSLGMIAEEMSIVLFFRDFFGANSAVPSLIEYVDVHGTANFRNAINAILAAIPFLQSIISGVFGDDWIAISSSNLYTNEISQSFDSGMGTNIIGDLYYTGGFVCVIALMFMLGCIIRKISNSTNKYALIVMACLVGNAVFMPRVEFFYITQSCGFAIIIYWIVNFLFPSHNPTHHKY